MPIALHVSQMSKKPMKKEAIDQVKKAKEAEIEQEVVNSMVGKFAK